MRGPFITGQFDHTLDEKGRVTLPAKYRKLFEEHAYLVESTDGAECVAVYHPESWAEHDQTYIQPKNVFADPDESWEVRVIYGFIEDVVPDKQGRIMLPKMFVERLGLTDKVKIVGNRDHLELWNPDTFQRLAETYRRTRQERRKGHAS
ncbi:MAG: division/cell wall cluster transcriptional repressor MraZ [Thermoleophilia bacterium]